MDPFLSEHRKQTADIDPMHVAPLSVQLRHFLVLCCDSVCSAVFRLRHILKKIQKDDISKEDLIKNLEYAASVLETVYIDETRSDFLFRTSPNKKSHLSILTWKD